MPIFFHSVGLGLFLYPGVAVWTRVAGPKCSSAIFLSSPPQPLHYVDGMYDGLHISTQYYT